MKPASVQTIIYNFICANEIRLVASFVFLSVISDFLLIRLFILFFGPLDMGSPFFLEMDMYSQFIWTVVYGPIIETVIFHLILIELFLYIFKRSKYGNHFSVIITAILFSMTHYYSIHYIVITLFFGIILGTAYIIAKTRNMLPFLVVFFIHAIYNGISLIVFGLTNYWSAKLY